MFLDGCPSILRVFFFCVCFFIYTLAQNGVHWSTHSLMLTIITGSSLTSGQQLSPAEAFSVLTIVTCGREKVNEITVMHTCARWVIERFPASSVCLDLAFALVLVTFISFEGNGILKTKRLFCPVSKLSWMGVCSSRHRFVWSNWRFLLICPRAL